MSTIGTKSYTAQVGPGNAASLAEAIPEAIEDIGGGTVRLSGLDELRNRTAETDGSVTDDEYGPQIWVAGESYPLFDDADAAVADALGAQTKYAEAKHAFEHARDLYAEALRAVVDSAGSIEAAVEVLQTIDENEIEALMGTGETEVKDVSSVNGDPPNG